MRRAVLLLIVLGLAGCAAPPQTASMQVATASAGGPPPGTPPGRNYIVFFQEWSAAFDTPALKTIAAAAAQAQSDPAATVTVTGYADPLGSVQANIYLTETRLANLMPGPIYWSSPLALLVPSATATNFTSRAALLLRKDLRLAVFDSAVMRGLAHRLLPDASVTVVPDYASLPARLGQVDAALWTLVQARAWAATHSGWTAVVPTDAGPPLSIAMMMPPNALAFGAYLQDWAEQQRADGFAAAQAAYWINGKPRSPERPRWNLLDALSGRD